MFHNTEDGPRPCDAQPGNCPVTRRTGEPHYGTLPEAQGAFEAAQGSTLPGHRRVVQVGLVPLAIEPGVRAMKGGSYFGVPVSQTALDGRLGAWRSVVGTEAAQAMEDAKVARDGGYHFHVTVLSPQETRMLRKSGTALPQDGTPVPLVLGGIGSVSDGDKEAWYVLATSPAMDAWRVERGLPPKAYHVTIGFVGGDVHTRGKGLETLRIS